MIGQRIGNYRIDSEHGRGAMGVVYMATDLRLDRRAILKFPASDGPLQDRTRERFEREARAASTLDHPNICTVYQIGETRLDDDSTRLFIAMAYYPGETLAEKIARGPISPARTAEWVAQIASGLNAAHRRGIIHRDIKAANVVITTDGIAKILDFGLAKLRDTPDSLSDGAPQGTPAYMAPEILLGREADEKSDLFALATLAYEMLTGRVPFAELRGPALMNALLSREPEPPSTRVTFPTRGSSPRVAALDPMAVDRVVSSGLAKEPAQRPETVVEFADLLRSALGHAPVSLEHPPNPSRNGTARSRSTALWVTGAVLLLGAAMVIFQDGKHSAPILETTKPLTRGQGMERSPAFSPDGERLAYASDELGNFDVWIRPLDSSRHAVPLTADYEGYDDFPVFSPDGRWIAFVSDREGGGVFLMSALGGPPRRLLSLPSVTSQESRIWVPSLAFSPEGRRLAVGEAMNHGGPWLLDLEGGKTEVLEKPDSVVEVPLVQPTFSPDGRILVMAAVGGVGTTISRLWSLDLGGQEPEPLTSGEHMDQFPVFHPGGRRLFFVSDRSGSADLWSMRLDRRGDPVGEPRPLTTGIGLGYPAVDPSGRRIIYAKLQDRSNIWTAHLGNHAVDFEDARQLTAENHMIEFMDVSKDGTRIVFDSNRGGNMDLWLMPYSGGEPRRLTDDPAHDFCPRFSPDDSEIAFYSLRSGNRDLWVLSLGDGSLRTLAPHGARDWMPVWSPDGRWIYFESTRSGNRDLWRVASDGTGEPERLTFHLAQDMYAVLSPDGGRLAFSSRRSGSQEVHILDLESREVSRLSRRGTFQVLMPFAWSEDGSEIFAQARESAVRTPNIWAFQVADGSSRPRTRFEGHRRQLFETLTVRRGQAFFPVREQRGDLWLGEFGYP